MIMMRHALVRTVRSLPTCLGIGRAVPVAHRSDRMDLARRGGLVAITALAVLMGTATAAPKETSIAKEGKAKSAEPYLYFRPAPVATSSILSLSRLTEFASADAFGGTRGLEESKTLTLFSSAGKGAEAAKGVSVQVRSRMTPVPGRTATAVYDISAALGFRGFGLDAGMTRATESSHLFAQAMGVGLSYGGPDWLTRLSVSEQRFMPDPLANFGLIEPRRALSFEWGSHLQLTPSWALNSSIRYAIGQSMTSIDPSQTNRTRAVFVGAAFTF